MKRALIGLINSSPARFRNVKTRKMYRPSALVPIAL